MIDVRKRMNSAPDIDGLDKSACNISEEGRLTEGGNDAEKESRGIFSFFSKRTTNASPIKGLKEKNLLLNKKKRMSQVLKDDQHSIDLFDNIAEYEQKGGILI